MRFRLAWRDGSASVMSGRCFEGVTEGYGGITVDFAGNRGGPDGLDILIIVAI